MVAHPIRAPPTTSNSSPVCGDAMEPAQPFEPRGHGQHRHQHASQQPITWRSYTTLKQVHKKRGSVQNQRSWLLCDYCGKRMELVFALVESDHCRPPLPRMLASQPQTQEKYLWASESVANKSSARWMQAHMQNALKGAHNAAKLHPAQVSESEALQDDDNDIMDSA